MQVGCEGPDGLLRIHDESEVCDVCRGAIGNDGELAWIDAWNHAYGIPPDSVEAQRMREAAEAARQRVAARLAAADLHREWYGSMPSDTPGIERAIAARRVTGPSLAELRARFAGWSCAEVSGTLPRDIASAKPSISGLLVTAGERPGLTQPAGEGER